MKSYTVGFVINKSHKLVLLINKNRPAWQKGALNGLGGRLQESETPNEGIARSVNREANIETNAEQWRKIGSIENDGDVIYFLTTVYDGETADATTMTDEQIEWFPLKNLPSTLVPYSKKMLSQVKKEIK